MRTASALSGFTSSGNLRYRHNEEYPRSLPTYPSASFRIIVTVAPQMLMVCGVTFTSISFLLMPGSSAIIWYLAPVSRDLSGSISCVFLITN